MICIDPHAGQGYNLKADLILVSHGHPNHNAADRIQNRSEACRIISNTDALANGKSKTFDPGHRPWIAALRYLSTCMLILTFFMTLFVLIPMGGSSKKLLFSGNGPYHHLLCPVLGSIFYIGFEGHCDSHTVLLPVVVTLVYGLIMLALNALRKVDGPYPFFRVHHQQAWTTALWMVILLLVTAGISQGVHWLAPARGSL